MAHLVETIAYAGKTPWHGIGTKVSNDISTSEMLVAAGLDWTVERKPLFWINDAGEEVESSLDALVRSTDDRVLSNVPKDWHELQNHEAFDFFREFVDAGNMSMEVAGSLKEGQIVWVLAKMKGDIKVLKKDVILPYILFTLPHEYGRSIDVRFSPIRVVCNNTLTMALARRGDLSVKWSHRKKFNADAVKSTLGIAQNHLAEYGRVAEFLGSKKAKKEQLREYVSMIFPHTAPPASGEARDPKELSRSAQVVFNAIEHQPGAEIAEGSWWQAFNAVTYSVDHVLGNSRETALNSAWYGPGRAKKLAALNAAIEFAEVA
jgi:phage/plasmid-like protein (TIGR03299 family)